jgi:hypothetical protein
VGALLDPQRHDGRAYRPTGPKLLSGPEIADAIGEALGRRVRLMEIPPWMFMRAVRVNAKRLGADLYFESGLRHYLPETGLGTWEVGGPTTHVRDVAGVEPEDFLTIARRYVDAADTRRTAGKMLREIGNLMLTGLLPAHRLDRFDRRQQHPQPARPRNSAESTVWRSEHAPSVDPVHHRFGPARTPDAQAPQEDSGATAATDSRGPMSRRNGGYSSRSSVL